MKINKIEIENFKAFKKEELELNDLIILMGANSVGKTTIIQLFLLLLQTFNKKSMYSALNINGDFVKFGEAKNLFYNHITSNDIKLNLEFDQNIDKVFLIKAKEELVYRRYFIFSKMDRVMSVFYKLKLTENLFQVMHLIDEESTYAKIKKSMDEINTILEKNKDLELTDEINKTIDFLKNFDLISIKHLDDFIKKLDDHSQDTMKVNFEFFYKNNDIFIKKFVIGNNKNIEFISFNLVKNKYKVSSKIYNINNNYNKYIKQNSINPVSFDELVNQEVNHDSNLFIHFLTAIIQHTDLSLKQYFSTNNIKYLSPLRAVPQRHYTIENTLDENWNSFNSDQVAKLIKLNPSIIDKTNKWLSKLGISVEGTNIIKGSLYSLLVKQKDLSLDLTDVGFGISQILPILLTSILSKNESIIIIEQPEIHLHPKAQSDLADFFIELSKKDKKCFIIETHSEYFIKRLRRRMAENLNIDAEIFIDSKNVSILTIENTKTDENKINPIKISSSGSFKWPKDFISDEDDDLIYLKYQKNIVKDLS